MVISKLLAASFLWVCVATNAHANNIKAMVDEALQNGSSEGVFDGGVAKIFTSTSKSDEPVKVRIKRIEKFSRGCGRLRFEMEQRIKDEQGGAGTIYPWVELNLCPDGNPPIEKINEKRQEEQKKLQACQVRVEKGGKDKKTGHQHGLLSATGCPQNGMSHWRYEGNCDAMKMPEKIVTNTPISKNGKIAIELLVPSQCQSKQNIWTGWVQEQSGEAIGMVKVMW